jgi:PncC family amidohydrolase
MSKPTLAVAESLTGGLVADAFVSVKGASEFFKGGIIAYSLSIKHDILQVPYSLLDDSNGVSKSVCCEMAKTVANNFAADYGLATTGYAEEGKEQFRLTEDRYAYVTLYT